MDVPDESDLIEAIKALRIKGPEIGRKKVLDNLRQNHGWKLSMKRLKSCMIKNQLDRDSVKKMREKSGHNSGQIEVQKDTITEFHIKYYSEGKNGHRLDFPQSIGILQKFAAEDPFMMSFFLYDTPTQLSKRPFSTLSAIQQAYALFYAEWDSYLGPVTQEVAKKAEWLPKLEFSIYRGFVVGGTWEPEMKAVGISVEKYIHNRLKDPTDGCRTKPRWLQWALTQTEDCDTIKMLNSVLVASHNLKCRYLGIGHILEGKKPHEPFNYSFRIVDGVIFARKTKDSPEEKISR